MSGSFDGRQALCLAPAVDLINHHAQAQVPVDLAALPMNATLCRCGGCGQNSCKRRAPDGHVGGMFNCRLSPRRLATTIFGSDFRSPRSGLSAVVRFRHNLSKRRTTVATLH